MDMEVTIIRHSHGGFFARRSDNKNMQSSYDVQKLINQIKSEGFALTISLETIVYLDKYQIPYVI